MKRVCVFCGSNSGNKPEYASAARALGRTLAEKKLGLVFGGGHIGLMGILADAALAAGGEVIGVIPEALEARELAHRHLTRLHVVKSMHERKALMADLADGFIALPGGFGTLEEFCEVLTWAQLGLHAKPCGVLNVLGFYDLLLRLFDREVSEDFLTSEHRGMVLQSADPDELLDRMGRFVSPFVPKWITSTET